MASPDPRRRRRLLAVGFAAVLALEVTGFAVARSEAAPQPRAAAGATRPDTTPERRELPVAGASRSLESGESAAVPTAAAPRQAALVRRAGPSAAKPRGMQPAVQAAAPTPRPTRAASGRAAGSDHQGRNHLWIPSLGIDRVVNSFPCSRTRPPDNRVYRWGCSGRNNVYLLGHAYNVFKPLHDAYVRGRLVKGLKAFYADGTGTVRTYAVAWWKLTRPTTSASWAWAPQKWPSMTLQTCVGASSEFRLMVRLVEVD